MNASRPFGPAQFGWNIFSIREFKYLSPLLIALFAGLLMIASTCGQSCIFLCLQARQSTKSKKLAKLRHSLIGLAGLFLNRSAG